MDKNEIKKALYKEKVLAKKVKATTKGFLYETTCSLGKVEFLIPYEEVAISLADDIQASLLIRWLV